MRVTIRPASLEDVCSFYSGCDVPVRMIAMEIDGEVVGIGGLAWLDDGVFAISWLKDAARASPRSILRGAHIVQAMMEEHGGLVYATPDPDEPTAVALLTHIGFERHEKDDLYVYRPERF